MGSKWQNRPTRIKLHHPDIAGALTQWKDELVSGNRSVVSSGKDTRQRLAALMQMVDREWWAGRPFRSVQALRPQAEKSVPVGSEIQRVSIGGQCCLATA